MSIFGNIQSTIFGSDTTERPVRGPASHHEPTQVAGALPRASDPATAAEIDARLAQIAAGKGAPSNYKTSIIELMRLLNIDSSLGNRIELAKELGYTGDTNDSATMSIWLHEAVMKTLTTRSA